MTADHFEVLVEEPSTEVFLTHVLPRVLGEAATFSIYAHQGKRDLLAQLSARLRGYAKWLPPSSRVVVLVDLDSDDCKTLKAQLEACSAAARLATRSSAAPGQPWRVVNRIAIEELEAWFFGDWQGVTAAFPRLPASFVARAGYRDSDAIAGGTWEALDRALRKRAYYPGGLQKVDAARRIAARFDPARCTSRSFIAFRDALAEAVVAPDAAPSMQPT